MRQRQQGRSNGAEHLGENDDSRLGGMNILPNVSHMRFWSVQK